MTDDWSGFVAGLVETGATSPIVPWVATMTEHVLREGTPFVVEAFGGARHDRFLLGFEDYERAVRDSPRYERFMASIVFTRSLLFVGADLPTVERFLNISGAAGAPRIRPHWAVVPWQADVDLQRERLRDRYGVQLMVYAPGRDAEAVIQFLATLADRVASLPRPPDQRPDVPTLTRVRLENIGPFTELTLELQSDHTILLGDNGCDKTSVLRAIALALIGESQGGNDTAE